MLSLVGPAHRLRAALAHLFHRRCAHLREPARHAARAVAPRAVAGAAARDLRPDSGAARDTGQYEPEWLDRVEPSDFMLEDYRHHPPLTAPMAV